MEEEVQAAVFGNVGTTVSFRVGPLDAELLEKVFAPEFTQEDLVNLGFAQIYLSLMIDGIGSRPFSAVTIPPIEAPSRSYRQEVIDSSRQQFATARTGIETALFSRLAEAAEEAAALHKAASVGPAKRPQQGQNRPQTAAPRREERRSEQRPPERPQPKAAERSAEDLKSILRATVEKAQKDKGKKEEGKQASLKDALNDVVPPPEKKQEEPPAAHTPKAAFEVPEETLRSLFKDV